MIINQSGGKENLTEVLTTQDELIAQIQAALESKVASSTPEIITSSTKVEEGTNSSYPEGTLYIVYKEE